MTQEPLPGIDEEPVPNPEPPADQQVHLADPDSPGEEAGDGAEQGMDS